MIWFVTFRLGCLSTLESVALSLVILLKTFLHLILHFWSDHFWRIHTKCHKNAICNGLLIMGPGKQIPDLDKLGFLRLKEKYIEVGLYFISLIWRFCCCCRYFGEITLRPELFRMNENFGEVLEFEHIKIGGIHCQEWSLVWGKYINTAYGW